MAKFTRQHLNNEPELLPQQDNHEEFGLLMSLSLDKMLDPVAEDRLRAHLAQCRVCAQQWRIWQAIDTRLQSAVMLEPPADFARQVAHRIEQRQSRRNLWVGVGLAVLTIGVWAISLIGVVSIVALLMFGLVSLLPDILLFLADGWANVSALFNSFWQLGSGLSSAPSARIWISCYLLFGLVTLALWTRVLRRTTRTIDASSVHKLV
jgi:hypothetical protein